MRSDLRENFLITGDIKGNVIMWEIKTSHNVSKLVEKKLIKDQHEQISSIYYSLELQCFAVASFDGSVLLYNSITGKKLRAYYHPKNEVINEVALKLFRL
jgi:WD40 repeat protein